MATLVTIVTTEGRTIQGLNYRMDPSVAIRPNVPRSPLSGGIYHVHTRLGWIEIPASQVKSLTVKPGART